MDENVQDGTLQVHISIRDEIRGVRQEVRELRDDTNRRFEAMETDLSKIRDTLKKFVYHFERDHLLPADDVDGLKKRVLRCEERLGLA